jgi:ammonium transporter, Amt family
LLHTFRIDDPVLTIAMPCSCGVWGVLFPGLLACEKYVAEVYTTGNAGICYGSHGKILACQLCEISTLLAWVMGVMGMFFFVLKRLSVLRVSAENEMRGLDHNIEGQPHVGCGAAAWFLIGLLAVSGCGG